MARNVFNYLGTLTAEINKKCSRYSISVSSQSQKLPAPNLVESEGCAEANLSTRTANVFGGAGGG